MSSYALHDPSPVRPAPAPTPEPRTVRVLAVGGDELLLDLVRQGVELADYARDAAAAVRLASWLRPDLVLLDADDCGGDALVLTERLREAAPDSKVVVLAESARPREVERALVAGADGYLGKGGAALALLAPLLGSARQSKPA